MTTRMISSTFATTTFDSGVIPAGQAVSPAGVSVEFLSTANKYGINIHDDVFYNFSPGVNTNGGKFLTYDQHDLRDYLVEGKALTNAMINIQRMRETPVAVQCYNVTPLRNITETIIVTNSNLDLQDGAIAALQFGEIFKAGFSSNLIGRNDGKLDDQREILYCERRVYAQDRSQEFYHPASMGQMAAPPAAPPVGVNTRWLNNWLLLDRTVTGQADMVIGPNMQILRLIEVECYERSNQQVTTLVPPAVADEFTHLDSQVVVFFPALTVNVVGEERSMTATEKAVEYSNVFLANQNQP